MCDDQAMHQKSTKDSSADEDIAALFRKGLQHYREGRLQQAQNVCQHILRKQQYPDALLISGMIAHQQREFKLAAECYQQFLAVKPDHAQTHYNLGLVLNELGHTERAIEHFKQSITIAADNAAAQRQLADAYTRLQRWEEAIKAYQKSLAIQAEDVVTIIKLGNVFYAAQRWPESIPLYEQALEMQPDNALVHRNLGVSLQKLGQLQKALKCFEQALSLDPDYTDARIKLSEVLRELSRAEAAVVQLEHVIGRNPDETEAHISLALTLRQMGQTELAIKRLEQLLIARPDFGVVYHHIALIKPKKELIPVVEKLISDPELPNSDTLYCHFALGNLFRDSKSYDQAFNHFLKANTLQRETFTYDPRGNIQNVDRLIKTYSKRFIQGKRQLGSVSQLPVFILGMPRSGTTLVEQIISSHPQVHGAGELGAFPGVKLAIAQQLKYANPPPEYMSLIDGEMAEEYSARYLQELAFHCPTAKRITDKLPGNFLSIGLIKILLPNARIIHCQRSPLDNCISLYFQCFQNHKFSFELTELGQYYLQYQRLMSHWKNLFPGEILNLQYEELVMDQERLSRQLIDHIGLQWDARCLDFHNNERDVMSSTNIQVRQPMYKNSINRWKHYEKHLQPLIEVLDLAK